MPAAGSGSPATRPLNDPQSALVAGKTQTFLPWNSWQRPYVGEQPTVWFHEVFRNDGTPYRESETRLIRDLIAAPTPPG